MSAIYLSLKQSYKAKQYFSQYFRQDISESHESLSHLAYTFHGFGHYPASFQITSLLRDDMT